MADHVTTAKTAVDSAFDTEYLKTDLKGRAVRAGAATLLGQGLQFVIQTVSTVVLARILVPADFGLVAMVTAVTNFASLFKDLGLSAATIQRAEITHEQISTLFWVNVACSVVIALLTAALAPAMAWFYGEPRLVLITVALSLVFLFGGLTVQHRALLQRQMRFAALAGLQVVSNSVGVGTAIAAAALGAGYWALVLMQATSALVLASGVWLLCGWRPGRPHRRAGVRSMLTFGANLTGFNILNYFARNLDNVLIGRVSGAVQLGFYSKAYGLLMFPISQITAPVAAVGVPALSRLQRDPDEYTRYYYRAINVIAFITMPMIICLAALSREVITIVLGDQWLEAAPIFKVLAFAALVQPVVNPVGWVYVSLGQADRMFRWATFAVPVTVLSFFVGLPWGAFGVAVSYTTIYITVVLFPCLWWAFRASPISISGWLKSIRCPLFASLCMYFVIETVRHWLGSTSALWVVFLSGATGASLFAVIVISWKQARTEVREAFHMLRRLRPRSAL